MYIIVFNVFLLCTVIFQFVYIHLKRMSLIRLIQESGAVKEGRMFSLKTIHYEVEHLQEIIKEKDVIIDNNNDKLHELENHVSELEDQCSKLERQLQAKRPELMDQQTEMDELGSSEQQMSDVMKHYEKFISDVTADYETMKQERNMARIHLANLEMAFADLIEKYERSKSIIIGYQQNQEVMLDQIEITNAAVTALQEQYENLKVYANKKLTEANEYLEKTDKKHISELAKVKSKVLQSKVRISELERTVSVISTSTRSGDAPIDENNKSMFTPLFSHFSYTN